MDHIRETLQEYPLLSAEEKALAEAYVAAHPEWAPLLEESRSFARRLTEAQAFATEPISHQALAYYITTRAFSPQLPSFLQSWAERIENAIANDDLVRSRYEELQRQFSTLEAWGTPEHFARVTGHTLPEAPLPPEAEAHLLQGIVEPGYQRLAQPSRVYVLRPWFVAAAMVLIAVYGLLFWAGSAFQSPASRLARLTPSEANWSAPDFSGEPLALESAQLIREAIELLDASRVSTLGLFPRYDLDRVRRAEALLLQALQRVLSPSGRTSAAHSTLALEALYFRGKVNLALGDLSGARLSLRQVVEQRGPHAAAAERLLDAIYAEAP